MTKPNDIQWKISFQFEGKTLVTDRCILLDQRIAFVDPLPPDGRGGDDLEAGEERYLRLRKYWTRPVSHRFSFYDLTVDPLGRYLGPKELLLNKKYISFLLRRIPEEMLFFEATDQKEMPVRIYRGGEHMGLLMPVCLPLGVGPELIARAEAGIVKDQVYLSRCYDFGYHNVPINHDESNRWLRRAAEEDCPEAFCWLGLKYFAGIGVVPDNEKSLILLERAIALGDKKAICWRARIIRVMTPEEYKAISIRLFLGMEKRAMEKESHL